MPALFLNDCIYTAFKSKLIFMNYGIERKRL